MPENILILADWRLASIVDDTVPPRVMPSHNSSNDGPRGIREAALAPLAGQVLPAHPMVGMVSRSQAAAHCRS